jgi:hypothetical protein
MKKPRLDVATRRRALASLLLKLGGIAAYVVAAAPTAISTESLFPAIDTITGKAPLDEQRRTWYSRHLEAMEESTLTARAGEEYRFLYLRSFDPPIMVRVSCPNRSKCMLIAKRLDGKGGYEPGRLVESLSRDLSPDEIDRFRSGLDRVGFWRPQPSKDCPGEVCLEGDGAQWILEGARGTDYHVWAVWSPESKGPYAGYRALGRYLLDLSKLQVGPDIY